MVFHVKRYLLFEVYGGIFVAAFAGGDSADGIILDVGGVYIILAGLSEGHAVQTVLGPVVFGDTHCSMLVADSSIRFPSGSRTTLS